MTPEDDEVLGEISFSMALHLEEVISGSLAALISLSSHRSAAVDDLLNHLSLAFPLGEVLAPKRQVAFNSTELLQLEDHG